MVKLFTRILAYNWRHYALAVLVFIAFWQTFSTFSAVRVADDKLRTAMSQNAAYFEKAFLAGDVFETQRIMWRIKNENIKRITFHPAQFEGSRWIFKEAIVGNLYDRPRAQITHNVPFISNGAELGRLVYVIDLMDVNSAVFGQNYVLFITVVFFFIGLLVLSNIGAIKTIFSIERCVDETNTLAAAGEHSKIRDSIQRSIQSLPAGLRSTPFAVLIGRLAEVLQKASRLESELAVSKATSDLAAQVAHDIRSPLAALGAAAKGLGLPKDQRMLVDGAIGRMQGIADDLLARYRAPGAESKAKPEVAILAVLIQQVIAEKRLQHDKAGMKIEFLAHNEDINALVEPKEFQRIISNLLNNSIEAVENSGNVSLGLSVLDGKTLIEIKDAGKGIPPEILARLGQKGETHGKAGGTGLGLYHARTTVETWGGSLKISSEPGKGTSVTIELPRIEAAKPASGAAVLLDDDPLVHMNWKLAAKAASVELKACKTPADLNAAIKSLPKDTPIYIDSDLGSNIKGEAIASELYNNGYSNISMATGHGPEKFAHLPWLKVTGKEPPWA